jgi:chromosome segregation ATPase
MRHTRSVPTTAMFVLVLTAAFGLATGTANAQENGGREAARRLQLLQQEKGQLGAKLKAATDKAEAMSKTAEENKRDAERTSRELKSSKRAHAELAARLEKLEEEQRVLQAKFDETSTALDQRNKEKQALEEVKAEQLTVLGRQSRLITTCRDSNAKLFGLGSDLLDRLRTETKRNSDPLFGLGEVDGYNFEQDSRENLNKFRLAEPEASAK